MISKSEWDFLSLGTHFYGPSLNGQHYIKVIQKNRCKSHFVSDLSPFGRWRALPDPTQRTIYFSLEGHPVCHQSFVRSLIISYTVVVRSWIVKGRHHNGRASFLSEESALLYVDT
ncbi:hypothetical protein CEXT_500171 [Caerostris extrusa]|uniref:Uncharacterized protein n=1 Tax=Caerostris extrusa TaxID=172846 RepID=A0AAV4N8I9_CAEEX|nr:hypothetical protein CEXT_500171 [Caerostris extrusa]